MLFDSIAAAAANLIGSLARRIPRMTENPSISMSFRMMGLVIFASLSVASAVPEISGSDSTGLSSPASGKVASLVTPESKENQVSDPRLALMQFRVESLEKQVQFLLDQRSEAIMHDPSVARIPLKDSVNRLYRVTGNAGVLLLVPMSVRENDGIVEMRLQVVNTSSVAINSLSFDIYAPPATPSDTKLPLDELEQKKWWASRTMHFSEKIEIPTGQAKVVTIRTRKEWSAAKLETLQFFEFVCGVWIPENQRSRQE